LIDGGYCTSGRSDAALIDEQVGIAAGVSEIGLAGGVGLNALGGVHLDVFVLVVEESRGVVGAAEPCVSVEEGVCLERQLKQFGEGLGLGHLRNVCL